MKVTPIPHTIREGHFKVRAQHSVLSLGVDTFSSTSVKNKAFFFFPFRSHTVPFPSLFLVEPSKETVNFKEITGVLLPTPSDPFFWQSFLMSIPYQSIELLHASLWLLCMNVLLNHFLLMDILFPNLYGYKQLSVIDILCMSPVYNKQHAWPFTFK